MTRGDTGGSVVVLMSGPAERLALDTLAFLAQEFPRLEGAGFERAVGRLAGRLPADATAAALSDFAVLLSTMAAAGRLPRLRPRRARAGKDEVLLIALLAAAQRGDTGRAIEAAIALLDTGHVQGVVGAARTLGRRLAEAGVVLRSIGGPAFEHVAGYPSIQAFGGGRTTTSAPDEPKRAVLRLLESA